MFFGEMPGQTPTFVGQGYKEEVSWELPEVAADEEDVLDLGEVCAWAHPICPCSLPGRVAKKRHTAFTYWIRQPPTTYEKCYGPVHLRFL